MIISKCSYGVMSNSSVSWWGGYLNNNKKKFLLLNIGLVGKEKLLYNIVVSLNMQH
jgi:hypothetical protein